MLYIYLLAQSFIIHPQLQKNLLQVPLTDVLHVFRRVYGVQVRKF